MIIWIQAARWGTYLKILTLRWMYYDKGWHINCCWIWKMCRMLLSLHNCRIKQFNNGSKCSCVFMKSTSTSCKRYSHQWRWKSSGRNYSRIFNSYKNYSSSIRSVIFLLRLGCFSSWFQDNRRWLGRLKSTRISCVRGFNMKNMSRNRRKSVNICISKSVSLRPERDN